MTATKGATSLGRDDVMEAVVGRTNLVAALKRVQGNKGSAGVDGMSTKELPDWLRRNWLLLRQQLLDGTMRRCP